MVDELDLRPGGTWRFIDPAETGYAFRGVYHVVDAPDGLVTTWSFDPLPGVFLQTVTFHALDSHTTQVTVQFVFASPEDRDMLLATTSDHGAHGMLHRLGQLLS